MTTPKCVVDLVNIAHIACGHFHNLAFDHQGQKLFVWGCNPQVLRLEAQQKRKKIKDVAAAAADDMVPEEAGVNEALAKKLEDLVHLTPTKVKTLKLQIVSMLCIKVLKITNNDTI